MKLLSCNFIILIRIKKKKIEKNLISSKIANIRVENKVFILFYVADINLGIFLLKFYLNLQKK